MNATGLSGTLFPGALRACAHQQPRITVEAEKAAGLEFTDEQRELMVRGPKRNLEQWEQLRQVPLPNAVPPAVQFDPQVPGEAAVLRVAKAYQDGTHFQTRRPPRFV